MIRVAADVGGTFTDIAMIGPDGLFRTRKVPSSPPDFGRAVVAGTLSMLSECGIAPGAVASMLHGCTVATNAILERKGARTGLVTTLGFRDVLELRRIRTPTLYDPLYEKPKPLVPRRFRYEVAERLDAAGTVITPLDEAGLREIAAAIAAARLEAVAVCFLHAYVNPAHEQMAGEILRECLPSCFVSISTQISPQIREYERTSTTVVNCYVGPPVERYLTDLNLELSQSGIGGDLLVMQSSGGVIPAATAAQQPAQIVECGPAAGVVGALNVSRALHHGDLITFDMGGTTAKASLIEKGSLQVAAEYEVGGAMSTGSKLMNGGGYVMNLPAIDISEIGAGGGSIVWIDKAGAIKVGPHSAGASPGPACYPQGGSEPTVTDANVVLGNLNPTALAGDTVPIDRERAAAAIARIAATQPGQTVESCAFGIVTVANSNMVRAIKAVTTYRGRDPRDFSLFAFGGNGGVHAAALASAMRIGRIIVPPGAGVFSAFGLLGADMQVTLLSSLMAPLDGLDPGRYNVAFEALEARVAERLPGARGQVVFERFADLRYRGQAFDLTLPMPAGPMDATMLAGLGAAFEAEHERVYGHRFRGNYPVQLLTLRCVGRVVEERQVGRGIVAVRGRPGASRLVYFGPGHGSQETAVIGRSDLATTPRKGPLIVEEYEGTTVVPPDWMAALDEAQNIVMTQS